MSPVLCKWCKASVLVVVIFVRYHMTEIVVHLIYKVKLTIRDLLLSCYQQFWFCLTHTSSWLVMNDTHESDICIRFLTTIILCIRFPGTVLWMALVVYASAHGGSIMIPSFWSCRSKTVNLCQLRNYYNHFFLVHLVCKVRVITVSKTVITYNHYSSDKKLEDTNNLVSWASYQIR